MQFGGILFYFFAFLGSQKIFLFSMLVDSRSWYGEGRGVVFYEFETQLKLSIAALSTFFTK